MSHIVSIRTRLHDPAALAATCRRLHLAEPVKGKASLYAGEVFGLIVQLPGWTYPVAVDTFSGEVKYDNYEGRWGDPRCLQNLIQMYAVEKTRLEARGKGCTVTETQLQDGSIRLRIQEG